MTGPWRHPCLRWWYKTESWHETSPLFIMLPCVACREPPTPRNDSDAANTQLQCYRIFHNLPTLPGHLILRASWTGVGPPRTSRLSSRMGPSAQPSSLPGNHPHGHQRAPDVTAPWATPIVPWSGPSRQPTYHPRRLYEVWSNRGSFPSSFSVTVTMSFPEDQHAQLLLPWFSRSLGCLQRQGPQHYGLVHPRVATLRSFGGLMSSLSAHSSTHSSYRASASVTITQPASHQQRFDNIVRHSIPHLFQMTKSAACHTVHIAPRCNLTRHRLSACGPSNTTFLAPARVRLTNNLLKNLSLPNHRA